jgi:transcription antitermination protein NusB
LINARRAARELALFCLLQADRCQPDGMLSPTAVPMAMQAIVRLMEDEAEDALQTAVIDLQAAYATVQEIEWDHPDNADSALEAPLVHVTLPKTDLTRTLIERCLKAADLIKASMHLPLLKVHLQNPDVVQHAQLLVNSVQNHRAEIDGRLNAVMDDWQMDRLFKLDACVLRQAMAEMLFVPTVDVSISINEAVELAKQYSSEESYRLVNGVLGKAAQSLNTPYVAPVKAEVNPADGDATEEGLDETVTAPVASAANTLPAQPLAPDQSAAPEQPAIPDSDKTPVFTSTAAYNPNGFSREFTPTSGDN